MEPTNRRYALASLFGQASDELVGHVPYAVRLGIRTVELGPGTVTLRLPYRDELVGDPTRGVVFGGVVTGLLDHGAGLATACALEELTAIATVDLRIDYLRAAEAGRDLYGRMECYKVTRDIAFVRGLAWEVNPADPFATCHATMMVGAHRKEQHPRCARRSGHRTGPVVTELVDVIPYARFIGAKVERGPNGLECVLPFREDLVGNVALPALHGGVLGAFLELTALLRLMDEARAVGVPKPINFSVDYLRSAGPKETRARATIFKLGQRIANVHVAAWQDDESKPVVAGNGKFLLRVARSRRGGA